MELTGVIQVWGLRSLALRGLWLSLCLLGLWTLSGGVTGKAWAQDPGVMGDGTGFVGMEIQDADLALRQALGLDEGRGGIMVRDVLPGGPADRAGFQRGELILGFEGVRVENLRQVVAYMQSAKPGQSVEFEVWRDGARQTRAVVLGDWPDGWRIKTNALAVVPRLGVTLAALTPEVRSSGGLRWGRTGVLIRSIESDAPALAYGLEAGDLVVAVGRTMVFDPADVDRLLAAMGPQWVLLVERDNQVRMVGPEVGTLLSDSARGGTAVPTAPVIEGERLLVARLADGGYVMDVDVIGEQGGSLPPRAGRVEALPEARLLPADAVREFDQVGLTVATLTAQRKDEMRLHWLSRGLVVTKVRANSPAALAGLAAGHVISRVNGQPGVTVDGLATALGAGDQSRALALLVEARNGFFLTALKRQQDEKQAAPTTDLLQKFAQPEK
jgi:S1-C subfamily serine protease